MDEQKTKRYTERIMNELDTTIKNSSTTSASFVKIIELCRRLRNALFNTPNLDEAEKVHALELLRKAKLAALFRQHAQNYILCIQLVENELKRIA